MESRHDSRRRRGGGSSSTSSHSASPPRRRRSTYRREQPLHAPLTSDNQYLSTNSTRRPRNPLPQPPQFSSNQRSLRRPRRLDRDSSLSFSDDPVDHVTEQNLWLEPADHLQTHHHVTTTGGLSEDTILKHLKTRTAVEKQTSEDEICSICHIEIEENNNLRIGTLDCGHEYHVDCITAWIKLKNQCPLCRTTGLTLKNGAD